MGIESRRFAILAGATVSLAVALVSQRVEAAEIVKASNTTTLNLVGSWSGGVVPTTVDIAVWSASYTGATTSMGAGATWGGIKQVSGGASGNTAGITKSNTLTLSRYGVDLSVAARNFAINTPLAFTASTVQPITVINGITLSGTSDNNVTLNTNAVVNVTGRWTTAGTFTINAGATVNFAPTSSGTAAVTGSTFTASTLMGAGAVFNNGQDFTGLTSGKVTAPGFSIAPAQYSSNPAGPADFSGTATIMRMVNFNADPSTALKLTGASSVAGMHFNTAPTADPNNTGWVVDTNGQLLSGFTYGVLVGQGVGANVTFRDSTATGGTGISLAGATSPTFYVRNYSTSFDVNLNVPMSNSAGSTVLNKAGGGRLNLGATNAMTGGVNVQEGIFRLGSGGAIVSGAVSVFNNAKFVIDNADGGNSTGSGTVTAQPGGIIGGTGTGGTVSLSAGVQSASTGLLAYSGGVLSPGPLSAAGTGIGNLTLNRLTINSASVLNFEFDVSSHDTVSVTQSGGLTINNLIGSTAFSGTINLYQTGTTSAFTTDGIYDLIAFNGTIAGAGITGLTVGNLGTTPWNLGLSANNVVTVAVGSFAVSPDYWNTDGNGNWGTAVNWTLGAEPNSPSAIAGFGGGNGATLTAPRTVSLEANKTVGSISFSTTGANTYTIASTVSEGITLDNGSSAGLITNVSGNNSITAPLTVSTAGALMTVTSASNTLSLGSISGGAVIKAGLGTVALTGNNTFASLNITGGTVKFGNGGAFGSAAGIGAITVAASGAVAVSRSDSYDLDAVLPPAVITGTGTVRVEGTGTATFKGSYTQTNFGIGGGLVKIAPTFSLLTANLSMTGGTLDIAGTNTFAVAGITGTGGVVTDSASTGVTDTIYITNTATAQSFSGSFVEQPGANKIALVHSTPVGTSVVAWTLGGSSNYSGGTMIGIGTEAVISNNFAFGSGPVTIQPGGSINSQRARVAFGNNLTVANDFNLYGYNNATTGAIYVPGTSDTVTLTGTINVYDGNNLTGGHFYGPTTSGWLKIQGPVVQQTAASVIVQNGRVQFGRTYSAAESNSFTSLTIKQGTVQLTAPNALPSGAVVTMGSDGLAILDLNNNNLEIAGAIRDTTLALTAANSPTVTNTGSTPVVLTLRPTADYSTGVSFAGTLTATLVNNKTITINNYSSASIAVTGGGKIILANPAATGSNVAAARVGTFSISGGGVIAVSPANRDVNRAKIVVTTPLLIGSDGSGGYTGTFDLADNDMIIRGETEATIFAMVAAGLHGHGGIISSVAGTGTGRDAYAGLAVIANSNLLGKNVTANFDGITASATGIAFATLIKYTYLGDTNLDGKVNVDDLNALVLGMQDTTLTGWRNGDINYDGHIDLTDLALLQASMNFAGTAFEDIHAGDVVTGAVPEPSALGLLLAAAPVLSRRRRR